MTNEREYTREQYRAWAEFHRFVQNAGGEMLRRELPGWDFGDGVMAANLGRVVVFTGGRKHGEV